MRSILRCTRCGREYEAAPGRYLCDACPSETIRGLPVHHGLLDVVHDLPRLRRRAALGRRATWESLGRGPGGIWRYRPLLPEVGDKDIVTLGEGGTPLLKASRLGRRLGVPQLYLKLETLNPTGAFKDRETSVAVSVGRSLGVPAVTCASTGSIAVSASAYAARAGLEAFVFAPAAVSSEKTAAMLVCGAHLVPVDAVYEEVLALESRARETFGWYDVSEAVNPYRIEGDKTTAYEVCGALGWRVPDWVLVPTGGGGHLSGLWKGFGELYALGLVDSLPRLASVGTEAGDPLAKAFAAGLDRVEPGEVGPTVAGALLSGYTDYGHVALRAVRESRGVAFAVGDRPILEAQRDLAVFEGVFAEPSAAAGLAGLPRLLAENAVREDETVVCLVTGSGVREAQAALGLVERPEVLPNSWEAVRERLRPGGSSPLAWRNTKGGVGGL